MYFIHIFRNDVSPIPARLLWSLLPAEDSDKERQDAGTQTGRVLHDFFRSPLGGLTTYKERNTNSYR